MRFRFDAHGRLRALQRNVSGEEVRIVMKRYEEEYDGWIAGSRIRVGRTNGRRLAVLFFSGSPMVIHSVWWEA